ncbi:MAG: hypothetical protein ABRQ38_05880 [Candidatus Eremiobacterota bacterium]|mgnify:CR=1 FL=1
MFINSNKTRHIASLALQKVKESPERELTESRGDAFLGAIRDYGVTKEEKLLAEMVKKSMVKAKETYKNVDTSAMQTVAFTALAKGITGPMGLLMADLGKVACSYSSGASNVYLEGIKEHGTEGQKSVVEFLEKTGLTVELKDVRDLQSFIFKSLKNTEQRDVDFARKHGYTIMKILNNNYDYDCTAVDGKKIGAMLIDLIAEKGEGKEKEFASALKEANLSNTDNQERAMKFITGGIEPAAKEALFKLLHKTFDPGLFGLLFKGSGNPAILSFIEKLAASNASTASELVPDAIKMIQNGKKELPEYSLIKLAGQNSASSFYYDVNRNEILMKTIAEKGELPENRTIAGKALEEVKEKPGFFKSIFKGKEGNLNRTREIYHEALGKISENCTHARVKQDNVNIYGEINNILNS